MVEGTPLLRVHPVKNWIQGSNPCVSAINNIQAHDSVGFFIFTEFAANILWLDWKVIAVSLVPSFSKQPNNRFAAI